MAKTAVAESEKTSTGLTIVRPDGYLALQETAELREAMAAASEAGEHITQSDLIRVPIPTGGQTTRWTIPNPVREETVDEITGILVFYQPCGVLWPGVDPAPGSLPVLRTFNPTDPNAQAEQIGPIPDAMIDTLERHRITPKGAVPALFNWSMLPYNQWGSGKGGVGKLCKEQRMLFILRENDIFPLLITAQPGSVKKVSSFFKQLTPTARVPYFRCVVSLRLEKAQSKSNQPFCRIVPKLEGILPSDVGEIIKQKWTEPLRQIAPKIDIVAEKTDEEE